MNPWLLGLACFAVGFGAGGGTTYTVLKEQGRIVPKPPQPVKR